MQNTRGKKISNSQVLEVILVLPSFHDFNFDQLQLHCNGFIAFSVV